MKFFNLRFYDTKFSLDLHLHTNKLSIQYKHNKNSIKVHILWRDYHNLVATRETGV
jgi:hypothetical protein